MANKFEEVEVNVNEFRSFPKSKTAEFRAYGSLFAAFCDILSQNNAFIVLVEEALVAKGAAQIKAIKRLTDALVLGEDRNRNCSRTALEVVRRAMVRHGEAGLVRNYPAIKELFGIMVRTTFTLIDRLKELENTSEINDAEFAITKIFMLLQGEEGQSFLDEKRDFFKVVNDAFEAFYRSCLSNISYLRQKYLMGIMEIKQAVQVVNEKVDATLYETSGHEHGHPLPDGREMDEKRFEMVQLGAQFVLNNKMTPAAAARKVIGIYSKKEKHPAYGPNQEDTFRRAISRAVEKQGVRVKICRG